MNFDKLRELDEAYQKAEGVRKLLAAKVELARRRLSSLEGRCEKALSVEAKAEKAYFAGVAANQKWIEGGMKEVVS